ncbi:hypothetical protein [Mycobacterium sp. IDR2000157661]|uniref:hypothetical protein n=1 Tax=Mycobacterium sp. IDR2000157661 TaxID=2867005 RepID=UPI001EEC6727|nr:hypothetical protein [Mycobacterium sp. IDR2000157661]ULE33195.1 hypothetical protein K3G64_24640 [Mycobacterium sp. IDR2000157661]
MTGVPDTAALPDRPAAVVVGAGIAGRAAFPETGGRPPLDNVSVLDHQLQTLPTRGRSAPLRRLAERQHR